ncbi:hypothetical protein M569_08131 [Genlisea aurea]|uniref:Uncharacterized protein n=1 Tax=Genlisea aurea TaxID=192259 RepID=S8CP80_9LAMI|nr:hypothetical protein M569_08131 [Genlisea aurea]
MASLQLRKEEEEEEEEEKHAAERDRVQKIATHYDSITDKAKHDQDSAISPSKRNGAQQDLLPAKDDDAAVEGGKGGAAAAGWSAVQYTMEKVAGATKTTADALSSAGHTVAEKITAAKDAVVATEEKAAQYAARKKVEAANDAEASRQRQVDDGGIMKAIGETLSEIGETTKEVIVGAGQYPHHPADYNTADDKHRNTAATDHPILS